MLSSSSSPYDLPSWAKGRFSNPPKHGRLHLANLPTPLYKIDVASVSKNIQSNGLAGSFFSALKSAGTSIYIKRDDCSSGVELGGNKVRKLEFLLAEALAEGASSVVTIGGEQSNHCRATAAASRMVGLSPRLILRTRKDDLDMTGNLLVDRIVGAQIFTCTPGEYGRFGSNELVSRVCQTLIADGEKPYPIPVGGSNGLGTWGYLNAVDELLQQCRTEGEEQLAFDDVVFACGSGGTATGIALGLALGHGTLDQCGRDRKIPKAVAVAVCDDPDYFFNFCADIATEMGLEIPSDKVSTESFLRDHMDVLQGKGLGYAVSTAEELEFVNDIARALGVVLDPVYSGKALYCFAKQLVNNVDSYQNKNILFWHTGGALGLFDKVSDLLPTMGEQQVRKLDVYGKGVGVDVSKSSNNKE